MNAENVTKYGKFNHEVAQQGGVDAYKAAQKELLNTIKEKSFQDGVSTGISTGRKEAAVACVGIAVVGGLIFAGYKYVKGKLYEKKDAKIQLEKDAEEAEQILTEEPLHEDIIKEIKEETENN